MVNAKIATKMTTIGIARIKSSFFICFSLLECFYNYKRRLHLPLTVPQKREKCLVLTCN